MEEIINFLKNNSKHSRYQLLPERLKALLGVSPEYAGQHYEAERLDFIRNSIVVQNSTIVDVGANTGFFTFELLEYGAKKAICFEGNKEHSEFIRLASNLLNMENRIDVRNSYFDFDVDLNDINTDVMLLLNVLHHVGDDYGDKKIPKFKALDQVALSLKKISKVSAFLVLQLGFNWKGDKKQPLFKNGTKSELIEFIKECSKDGFEIIRIGIAEKRNKKVIYLDLDKKNIKRDDRLGEFLNRPVFIMKSKVVK